MSNINWKEDLTAAKETAVNGITKAVGPLLAYCKVIAEYKASCPDKGSGTEFSSNCKEWLGIGAESAKKMALVGEDTRLVNVVNALPASWGTLYQLTMVKKDKFDAAVEDGRINPLMTRMNAVSLCDKTIDPNAEPKIYSQVKHKSKTVKLEIVKRTLEDTGDYRSIMPNVADDNPELCLAIAELIKKDTTGNQEEVDKTIKDLESLVKKAEKAKSDKAKEILEKSPEIINEAKAA